MPSNHTKTTDRVLSSFTIFFIISDMKRYMEIRPSLLQMVLPKLSNELGTNDRCLCFAPMKPYTGAQRDVKSLFVYE